MLDRPHTAAATAASAASMLAGLPEAAPEKSVESGATYQPSMWELILRHKKAAAAFLDFNTPEWRENDPEFLRLHRASWDAFRAVFDGEPTTAREAAKQFEYLLKAQKAEFDGVRPDELPVWFNLEKIAARFMLVTEQPRPLKRLPATSRGDKLTNTGLLLSYHCFLMLELNRVGEELYGDGRCAFNTIPMDGPVQRVLHNPGKHKSDYHPDLLRGRAKAVLQSLKIDTTKARRK